jgi:hypothetical protein
MDIDMLRQGKADQVTLVALVKDCATLEVDPDGLEFLADSVVSEDIAKDSEYKGTRILMDARMGNVCLRMHQGIDIGSGESDSDDRLAPPSGPHRRAAYVSHVGSDSRGLLSVASFRFACLLCRVGGASRVWLRVSRARCMTLFEDACARYSR